MARMRAFGLRRLLGVLLAATTLLGASGCFVLVVHKGDGPPEGRIRHITPGDSFEVEIHEDDSGMAEQAATTSSDKTKPAGSEPTPADRD